MPLACNISFVSDFELGHVKKNKNRTKRGYSPNFSERWDFPRDFGKNFEN